MKINKVAILSFIVASAISSSVFAAEGPITVNGGKVTFNGEVTDGACAVSGNDDSRIVNLDTVRAANFTAAGQYGNAKKAFTVDLTDCNTETVKSVSITFNGQTDATDPSVLVNTAGAGSATNVGLALFGPDGKPLEVGNESSVVNLTQSTSIPLSVDYKSTAATVMAGKVQSVANFQLTYN